MQKLVIWLLLAFMPFAGVRMVCVERPAVTMTSAAGSGTDCDDFCLRAKAPARNGASDNVECVLFGDGSLVVVISGVAVLPADAPIRFELAISKLASAVADYYLAPILTHPTPPPRA